VSHYDVLGVARSASHDEIRAAYHDRARALHPDRVASQPSSSQDEARRAMQDVNEAWRVLRDPALRAAYDRQTSAPPPPAPPASEWDTPYPHPLAEPGDLIVAIVRAAPWIAVLVVLGVIVVFTAFAHHTDSPRALIGKCIETTEGVPHEVECQGPNDGQVIDVVETEAACAPGTTARVMASGDWFCLTAD
jgi:curved DNA-binding protein CbpA